MSSKQHSAKARVKKPAKRRNRRMRRVWVSRDYGVDTNYDIWGKPPAIMESSVCYWMDGCDLQSMHCSYWFEKLTGIKLKPGECRQFDMLVTMTPVSKKGAK